MKHGRTEILQREGGHAGDENRDNPNRKPAANEPTPAVTTGSPPPHNHLDVPVLGHYLLLPAAAVLGSLDWRHPTTEELGQFECHTTGDEPHKLKEIRLLLAIMVADGEMVCITISC